MKGNRLQVLGYSFLFFILLSTVACTLYPTYAATDIGQSKISPANPLYFLKTIQEDLELKFAGTDNVKMIRKIEFATRRLREVKSLISGSHEDLIEPTLERYWSYISRLPDKDLKDEELIIRVKESLIIHLESLQRIYGQISNTRAKMSIRSIVNRLIQRVDIPDDAKLPSCKFLSREASSSALNEVERSILADRAKKCYSIPSLNRYPNL